MSREDLPSIGDFAEDNSNLPSIKDFLAEEVEAELPSVEDYIETEEKEILSEETQTIEDLDGNTFAEVKDIVPPWPELIRLINDIREEIPDIPEIKYYDKELENLAEEIRRVKENISTVPKVKYYDSEIESICEQIDLVKEFLANSISDLPEVKYYDDQIQEIELKISQINENVLNLPEPKYYEEDLELIKEKIEEIKNQIPIFPKWISEVDEAPDFSWIGKSFRSVDEDFVKINDSIETIRDKIQLDFDRLYEYNDIKNFENKVELKNEIKDIDKKYQKYKNEIYTKIEELTLKIWEYHKEFKDDDRKLKKQITGEYNSLKNNFEEKLKEFNDNSVKTDELLLNYFEDIREEVSNLPKVKYYDTQLDDVNTKIENIDNRLLSLNELYEIVESIKSSQTELKEQLLTQPPSIDNEDSLTPLDQNFATLEDLSSHYRLFINRIQQQLATIGGGGETRLEFLDDVDRSTAKTNGYVLQYDSSVGKFIGTSYVSGSGGDSYWSETNAGIYTTGNVAIGTDVVSTGSTALWVQGDARITGILSVGTGTITLDPTENTIRVGTGITLDATNNIVSIGNAITLNSTTGVIEVDGSTIGSPSGDANYTGIVTASAFVGDGSGLTGIVAAGSGVEVKDNNTLVGTASTLNFGTDLDVTFAGGVATIDVSIPLSALTDVNTSNLSGISTDYLMVYDPTVPGFKFVNPKTYFGINNDFNPAPDIVDYGSY